MRVALVLLPSWRRETPSLGLAYLASSLRKEGHEPIRLEFNLKVKSREWQKRLAKLENVKPYVDFCVKEILNEKPDVVAFSAYNCNFELSKLVAGWLENAKIFGGPEMLIDKSAMEALHYAQYAVFGDGEYLSEIVSKGKNAFDVAGLAYKKDGKLVRNPVVPLDINDIQFPEFRDQDIKDSEVPWMLPIIMGRGCDFCFERKFWGTFRARKPELVVEEIKEQKARHGIHNFRFNDCAINNNSSFIDFCALVKEEKVKWGGKFRIMNSSPDYKKMYDSGCRFLFFGAESASDNVLQKIGKGFRSESISRNIKEAHDAGIWVHLYLIAGYPTETAQDFQMTLDFLKSHEQYIDSFDINEFTVMECSDFACCPDAARFDQSLAIARRQAADLMFSHLKGYPYDLLLKRP